MMDIAVPPHCPYRTPAGSFMIDYMGITKKQNGPILFKSSFRIMDIAPSGSQANFIEILSAVRTYNIRITFYLIYIKAFQL